MKSKKNRPTVSKPSRNRSIPNSDSCSNKVVDGLIDNFSINTLRDRNRDLSGKQKAEHANDPPKCGRETQFITIFLLLFAACFICGQSFQYLNEIDHGSSLY